MLLTRILVAIAVAVLVFMYSYLGVWHLIGTDVAIIAVLPVVCVVSGLFGLVCYGLIALRETPERRRTWQYHVLVQGFVIAVVLCLLTPIYRQITVLASGVEFHLLTIGCTATFLECLLLRGTGWPSIRSLMLLIPIASVSFFLNFPVSYVVLAILDVVGATGSDISDGLLFLFLAYVCWFLGLFFYLVFTLSSSPSGGRRTLGVAMWISIGSVAITACAAVCVQMSPPPHDIGLPTGILYIACLVLISQATFWILHGGNFIFNRFIRTGTRL